MCSSKSFLVLLISMFQWVGGVQYGPSLDFLIPPGNERGRPSKQIHLDGFHPTYSVTLPLANNSAMALVSRVHPQGDFSVLAPTGWGIMAVVQTLRLRTGVVYSSSEDTFLKCRDFLRFTAGNQTAQVCGDVMKYSKEGSPQGLLGPRTFITTESQLTLALHVDRGHGVHDYSWHEQIALELVLTAFKECPRNGLLAQWKKWTGSNPLRSCSPAEDTFCIHSATFCDGVGNCAVRGPLGHVGYDEEGCSYTPAFGPTMGPPPPTPPPPTSTRTPYIGVNKPYTPPTSGKVISPIHLIFIFSVVVLVIFAGCTWLAKANEKKFQHTMYRFSTMRRQRRSQQTNPSSRGTRGTEPPTSPPDDATATINRRPSAPPDSAVNTLRVDVEIPGEEPPPYDHLFPSAPPNSTLHS
ncbi:uncharacterized protein LOC110851711 isoform X2 [Folsomia candida]|uniref:uncharacterized protein LOC110851711 isoform X2 n=1 Tax=Folsomia candida TaxID=158441 RepID=UPI000B8F2CCE|nr:uncharacterized protein LOC110851711 isoform X2 [Folsomia candida]